MQQQWLKRVLIPCWVIYILACILLFVVACYVLGGMSARVSNKAISNATGGLLVACCIITVGFVISEIVQLARERLGPVFHLCSNLLKLLIWIIYLLLAMIGAANSTQESTSLMSLSVTLVLIATSLAQLIYGSVVLHRHRMDKRPAMLQSDSTESGTSSTQDSISKSRSIEQRDLDPEKPELYGDNINRNDDPHQQHPPAGSRSARNLAELDGAPVVELDSEKPVSELPAKEKAKIVYEEA
ncbi:hypothetical protein Q7P37_010352 [Cladosporium fusiforme]